MEKWEQTTFIPIINGQSINGSNKNNDGLAKFKDLPKEAGGSGVELAD